MSKQYFIYNTDDNGWKDTNRIVNVSKGDQKVIRAAGLSEELQIYQMVGECAQCAPNDVLWEPVYICGEPLTLDSVNNTLWFTLPGKYSIGDPNDDSSLAGDVNITGEVHKGVDLSTLGKCQGVLEVEVINDADTPVPVTGEVSIDGPVDVQNSDDNPLNVIGDVNVVNTDPIAVNGQVEVTEYSGDPIDVVLPENAEVRVNNTEDDPVHVSISPDQMGIEVGETSLGCVVNDEDEIVARVTTYTEVDEATGVKSTVKVAHYLDGTTVDPYDGPWQICEDTEVQVDCVESQSFHFGIENLVRPENTAVLEVTLSDGTSFQFDQEPWNGEGNAWAYTTANIRDAFRAYAEDNSLKWLAEARLVKEAGDPSDIAEPQDISPYGTIYGVPSPYMGVALAEAGMVGRYANIEVCRGEIYPVSIVIVSSDSTRPDSQPGAPLLLVGPLEDKRRRFFICRSCGDEPVWYHSDGATEVGTAEKPMCYEPCGTLSTLPVPGSPVNQFDFENGCDTNGSDNAEDWTSGVTRRVSYQGGGQVIVSFYQRLLDNPNDPSSGQLEPYDLLGEFVDCSSGQIPPVPEEPVPTSDVQSFAGILYRPSDINSDGDPDSVEAISVTRLLNGKLVNSETGSLVTVDDEDTWKQPASQTKHAFTETITSTETKSISLGEKWTAQNRTGGIVFFSYTPNDSSSHVYEADDRAMIEGSAIGDLEIIIPDTFNPSEANPGVTFSYYREIWG